MRAPVPARGRRSDSRLRRLLPPRTVVPALLVVLAAGCVSIPDSSSVQPGRAVGAQNERPLSTNVPEKPRPGAGRKEIAAGYLNAMLAYPPNPDIVRSFLTPEAAADWNPSDASVVYTATDRPELSETADRVIFRAQTLGSLDRRGSWRTARARDSLLTAGLRMDRTNGEWRLTNPLPGTYVDSDYFATYYADFSLYFFDAGRGVLTPDPVFLLLGDTVATALVTGLLRGPTAELAGVVTSAVPETTRVDLSVSVSESGVAEVPLTGEVLELSADDRLLFAAQLTWTLRALEDIRSIVVTVDGTRVNLGAGTSMSVEEFPGFDPAGWAAKRSLYALSRRGLVAVTDEETVLAPPSVRAASRTARSVAVDPSGSLAATVSADGRSVRVSSLTPADPSSSVWFPSGSNLLRPSWDTHRVLWLVDDTRRGARLYIATADRVDALDAPGLTGRHVSSYAVSRDGVRLAAVVGRGTSARLVISVIDRDPADGTRLGLRPAREVVSPRPTPTALRSIAWASPTSVAGLARDEGGELSPFEYAVDGSTVTPVVGFLPTRPVRLAAAPNSTTFLAIGDDRGGVYVRTADAQWTRVGGDARLRAPVYPG